MLMPVSDMTGRDVSPSTGSHGSLTLPGETRRVPQRTAPQRAGVPTRGRMVGSGTEYLAVGEREGDRGPSRLDSKFRCGVRVGLEAKAKVASPMLPSLES